MKEKLKNTLIPITLILLLLFVFANLAYLMTKIDGDLILSITKKVFDFSFHLRRIYNLIILDMELGLNPLQQEKPVHN